MNKGQERQFGFFTALVILAVGLWRLLVGGGHAWYWIVGAIGLAVATALFPRIWVPLLRVWMPITRILGWINTRILLAAVFFVVLLPMAWLLRIVGHDPLRIRTERQEPVWVQRGTDWPPASFKDQF
jgi:hypothetical protein